MFLTDVSDITSATQTWFLDQWPEICTSSRTLPDPLISGTLEPLLGQGTTTIGDCRIACGTARLIKLTGLSTLVIQNPSVVYKTCSKHWSAYIMFPLVTSSLQGKLTSYSMDSESSNQHMSRNVNVSAVSGTLLLVVPLKKNSESSYTFDFVNTDVSMNLGLSFEKTGSSYVDAALDVQANEFVGALRKTLSNLPLKNNFKNTLGAALLTKRTYSMTINPWVAQGCTLSGPCHPCDTCCLCMSTQLCSEECMKCECITCESKSTSWKWLFLVAVVILLSILLLKQI